MTDRPIIFSAPMVLALLAGRKTQTRRLGSSPLRRCAVGDRLYVREAFANVPASAYRHSEGVEQVLNPGDPYEAAVFAAGWDRSIPKWRPSIHMPRWASRLTLIVEQVRLQWLQDIDEADAIAEGIERIDDPRGTAWKSYETYPDGTRHPHASVPNRSPVTSFMELWNSLHTTPGERWQDNPDIVALTFRVERENIDRIAA